jgi:putative FmdB family regulatory protein
MPTYEYQCVSCGHRFEAFQAISDEPIRVCPKCGSRVQRLISGGSGLIFKGSGFYATDYQHKKSFTNSDSDIEKPQGEKPKEKAKKED